MAENDNRACEAVFRAISCLPNPFPKVQEYPDLDAAGLLLVALGHLVKAKERLGEMPKSAVVYRAKHITTCAASWIRYALKELAREKEETCEKS